MLFGSPRHIGAPRFVIRWAAAHWCAEICYQVGRGTLVRLDAIRCAVTHYSEPEDAIRCAVTHYSEPEDAIRCAVTH